jgi:C4-dicarboxylate-specific signal transduction histidine kinase
VDSTEDAAEAKKANFRVGTQEILRQKQLALIGKVLASFSDEMQRCLGTIQESTVGLGDLVGQASRWTKEDRERFTGVLSTIERHVEMSAQKSHHLNRFARRTDALFFTFDAGELVEEAVSFSTRFARIREVSLSREAAGPSPVICSDPVRIQFLVLILIDTMLERVNRGGKVTLRAKSADKGVVIEVEGHSTLEGMAPSQPEQGNPYWALVEKVVGDLGGRLQIDSVSHEIYRTTLFLPTREVSDTFQI